MDSPSTWTMRWVPQIEAIDRAAWDRLALPLKTPFLEWDWLGLMEASGSAAARAGWTPHHLTVWSGGELVAAAPLYIKRHSAGEFVFDHAWAEAADRLGVDYYPKLVGMSPFTPLIGYRFLTAPEADVEALTARMLSEIDAHCRRRGLSGASFLFADPLWSPLTSRAGYSAWVHPSFVWENDGFADFEDYLSQFNSNQRRNIRRERLQLARAGITVEMVPGAKLPQEFYRRMYRFYARTNDQFGPWGCKFLAPEFFERLGERFGHRLVFGVARSRESGPAPIGMSMCVAKGDCLYGRYWGARAEVEFLHFEACYYSPIAWAIDHGLKRFDPGAGGGHKLRRGFRLTPNVSLHRFQSPALRRVMERHIDAINRRERKQIDAINLELPLRRQRS
jgi:uncharacterized protein